MLSTALKRHLPASGALSAALALANAAAAQTAPAAAQPAPAEEPAQVEEIVVTGYRSSLQGRAGRQASRQPARST
jgi:iron complex outermembrane receptor protein